MNLFGFEYYKKAQSDKLSYHKGWSWKPAKLDLIQNPKKVLNFNESVEVFMPQKFSKGYTLLLSKKNTAVGSLISELRKSKKPFLYLNWDELVGEAVIEYNSEEKKYLIKYKNHSFDLLKVKSVYWDYSNLSEVFYFKRARFSNKEKVFLSRWIEVLNALEFILSEKKWYPAKPSSMKYEGQHKFGELLLAQKLGLKIPKMLYSNDPRETEKFLKNTNSIMKESGIKFFEDSRGNIQIFESKKIESTDKKIKNLQFSPCLFQEFIDKKFDVRATVVGNKVLSVKINSQENLKSKSDWRGSEHLTPMTQYKLPTAIEKKLTQMQKKLGFQLASFDLVVDQKNNFYLLEMNRPGQWLYMEALAGVPISKTLASNL